MLFFVVSKVNCYSLSSCIRFVKNKVLNERRLNIVSNFIAKSYKLLVNIKQ